MNKLIIVDGFIIATADTSWGQDANADEIEAMLCHKPTAPDGYAYKLRADTLEWELVEIQPEPEPSEEDISDEEALNIILGGGAE